MSPAGREPKPHIHPIRYRVWPVTLALTIVALLCLHVTLQYDRFHTRLLPVEFHALFDLDEEQNVPSWFSGMQLLLAAALAFALATAQRRAAPADARAWNAIAAALVFASLDEIAGIHETVNSLIVMSWAIPFGILALVVAAAFVPFVRRLPAPARNGILVSGALYFTGAIIVELITNQYFDQDTKRQFRYALFSLVEEALELFGVWVLVRTLLAHIDTSRLSLAVVSETEADPTRP